MAEAVQDVTITEEVVAVNAEAQADLEEEVLVAEVSVQEKKADSEATEMMLQENVQTDQEEKADSEVRALQKGNPVLSKEKKELQDVLKEATGQQDVRSKRLKAESQEEAKA